MPGRAPPKSMVCPCGKPFETRDGDRYCLSCRRKMLSDMYRSGYLTPLSSDAPPRPTEAREDHRGNEDNPGFEDAVRVIEDGP